MTDQPTFLYFVDTTPAETFEEYHERNPHVWVLFRRFTLEAIASGRSRIGAKMIAERIRWETFIRASNGDDFKINNNFTAYYARRFMAEYPEHEGIFQTRASKADVELAA